MKASRSSGDEVLGRFTEPAHVGLPDGYQGAAGLLLAALEVDPDRRREAVAVELGGIRR